MTKSTIVIDTILEQLGGMKFMAMTRAIVWAHDANSISIRFKGCRKANLLIVELTDDDLYDLSFYRMNKCYEMKLKYESKGIYWDQLQEIFTRYTGLDTHL